MKRGESLFFGLVGILAVLMLLAAIATEFYPIFTK